MPEIPDTTLYLIFSWPFHTLAMNRILNTVISRKKPSNCGFFLDLRDMMRIGGMKAVFAGYFTAMLFQVYGTAKYQVEWNETEEIDDEIEKIEA